MTAIAGDVAITGATGFIGGRLAQILGSNARLLTRKRNGVIGSHPVRFDIESDLSNALQGCRAVVHCAFDFQKLADNLPIAQALARACVTNGIRFVQLSSWVVYEPVPDADLDETGTTAPGGNPYKDTKIAIEDMLLRAAARDGLDVVILQPTIVYGPFGSAWTDSPVRELTTGLVTLPDMGDGVCNAVYVDDVCQAVVAALAPQVPSGGRFLISGPTPVTWRDFLHGYESILGLSSLQLMPYGSLPAARERSSAGVLGPMAKRLLARFFSTQTRARLNFKVKRTLQRYRGDTVYRLTEDRLALYQSKCRVRIDRAIGELGYVPQFDLSQGMAATAPYLRRAYPHKGLAA